MSQGDPKAEIGYTLFGRGPPYRSQVELRGARRSKMAVSCCGYDGDYLMLEPIEYPQVRGMNDPREGNAYFRVMSNSDLQLNCQEMEAVCEKMLHYQALVSNGR